MISYSEKGQQCVNTILNTTSIGHHNRFINLIQEEEITHQRIS